MDDKAIDVMRKGKEWAIVYSFFHPCGRPAMGYAEAAATGVSVRRQGVGEIARGIPLTLVYAAYNAEKKDYWKAEISILTGLGASDNLLVSVTDAQDEKIESASLTLLGSKLSVNKGVAMYRLSDFQKNLKNTTVSLIRPSGVEIEGTLMLGDDFL